MDDINERPPSHLDTGPYYTVHFLFHFRIAALYRIEIKVFDIVTLQHAGGGAAAETDPVGRAADLDNEFPVSIRDGVLRGTLDGRPIPETPVARRGAEILLGAGPGALRAVAARDGERILVHLGGRVRAFETGGPAARRRGGGGHRRHAADEPFAASPMTGTVTEVAVKPGDAVAAGGTLAIVEAMKMQFVVRAPRAVVVKAVLAAAGKPVEIGAVLVEFEAAPKG